MLMFLLALQAAVPTPAAPPPASVADIPNLTVAYYDVAGRDRDAIRRAMDKVRPTDRSDGQRVDATTSWRFKWRCPGGPNGCDVSRAEVSYTVDMLLPRPTEYDRLSTRERGRWDRYITALTAHERNHALLATRGAAELERAIRQAPDCETAKPAAQKVMDVLSAASREYDRRTRHGAAEGITY